jgi:hypothetical protein
MKSLISLATITLLLHLATTNGAQSAETKPSSDARGATAAAVFGDYFEIQRALAGDTLENVAAHARGIADRVRQDTGGLFRPELAAQAEALATARDLTTARQIFKAVSGYLIQTYRAGNGPGGAIREAHSPAANVNWLQRDDIVQNPYLGKSGLHFGTFVS